MNDEDLTRLAVSQLIEEGEKFKRRHELRYKLEEPSRLRPNLRYFKNTLKNCVSSNERKEKIRKSKAADELKYLEKRAKKVEAGSKNEENTNDKQISRDSSAENRYGNNCSYTSKKESSNKTHRKSMKKS